MTAPPRPSIYNLQRFLLGALPPSEAAPVIAWVESSPEAPRALAGIAAHDALTKAVESTVGIQSPPALAVARIVEKVTASYQAAIESLPDAAEQTRRSSAAPSRQGGLAAPDRFGQFRIVRELGRGGMGVVYEVMDEYLGRRAAVKVLGPELAVNDEARRRFLREGRAAADLNSDHIVTIYQVGEVDGVPFLAMEFIEGVTLETWRKTRSVPVTAEDMLWVARDLLTGLAAAHKKGRIHRDMKLANAMIERDTRRVKILDFGLTRGGDEGEQLTTPGRVLGTPAYMSPEQAHGKALDVRSDLFSVGVTLHALAIGRSPFARDSIPATLVALVTDTPAPLTQLPEPLRAFVARLMSRDPNGRPADASAALAELKKVEERLTAPPRPIPVPPPLPAPAPLPVAVPLRLAPKSTRRTWTRVLIAIGAVLVIATILIVRDKSNKAEPVDPNKDNSTAGPMPPSEPNGSPRSVLRASALQLGARVIVTFQTPGYGSLTTDEMPLGVLDRGTRGTITELPDDESRCRVRLDNAARDEVWILCDCLMPD